MRATVFYSLNKKTPFLVLILSLLTTLGLFAQPRSGRSWGGADNSARNIGRFYGKVVDENGKGIGFATIQLIGKQFDRQTKKLKEGLIAGQITEENGDFSLEKLPIRGEFTLKISVLGYASMEKTVSFGVSGGKPQKGQGGRPSQGRGSWGGSMGGANFDKDLGNIMLNPDVKTLKEVVVKGEAANVQLALDRKIFKVDKDASAAGGTAEDALKNVPSLSVDLDGNLTLRNASPQLFVDGRPTQLSLDQISADEIETVEVITNPSAKYDASGGQAGIVNIVLKKNRRIGYNGSVRAGVDSRGGVNGGGNINLREGKVNIFLSGNYFGRKRVGETETRRENLFGNPLTNVLQLGEDDNGGFFSSLRGGFDWFVDNRNTVTFQGAYRRGQFDSDNLLNTTTDTLLSGFTNSSQSIRTTDRDRGFQGVGGSILYKHNFPKQGKFLTADINYNRFTNNNLSLFETEFLESGFSSRERQEGGGGSTFITIQADYEEPIGKNGKIELGARGAFRDYENSNANLVFDPDQNQFIRIFNFADEYSFKDDILAAYVTFSQEFKKWGYQVGLRAESSRYTGTLPEAQATFENDFPFNLFPSAFITRRLNEADNIQLSYTRRINRPSFFNLIPFTDFTDSLNLRRGNPDLIPEFTNSVELTYQNIFDKGDNLLVSAYFKQASNLITTFQVNEFDETLGQEVVVTTYENSNSSLAYGVELTVRNTFAKIFELTSNLNLYNSRVDASNIEEGLINEQFTWFLKENLRIKIPKLFTLQINGQYQSRAAFTPSNNSGRFRGWRRNTNTAQGYTKDFWFIDVSIRKDILKRKGSLTLSVSDVFRSRQTGSFTESEFFIQDSWRLRNPQLVRLNFSYRFGKMDASLFKRKNTKIDNSGSEMMN